jgi:hypothetical protein
VQLALEDEGRSVVERERLKWREGKLLQAHQEEWLGELAPFLLDNVGQPSWAANRRRLKALDLGGNALTAQGVALLLAAAIPARTDRQQTPEQLAQHHYLYEGEFE